MSKDEIKALTVDYAWGCGINPNIALAQINRESRFNPGANGSSGEKGIAQFMPGTWVRFGYGDFNNAYDPNYALDAWCAYMQWLLNRYGYNYEKALQGYNGGEGNVDRGTVSSGARTYAREVLAAAGSDASGENWPTDVPVAQTNPPLPPPQETNWMPFAIIGGLALLLIFAISD